MDVFVDGMWFLGVSSTNKGVFVDEDEDGGAGIGGNCISAHNCLFLLYEKDLCYSAGGGGGLRLPAGIQDGVRPEL